MFDTREGIPKNLAGLTTNKNRYGGLYLSNSADHLTNLIKEMSDMSGDELRGVRLGFAANVKCQG